MGWVGATLTPFEIGAPLGGALADDALRTTIALKKVNTANKLSSAAVKADIAKRMVPKLRIDSKQFGKKGGRHAHDFGFDPKSAVGRQWIRNRVEDIMTRYDVRQGPWNPDGGGAIDHLFVLQGEDVVLFKANCDFVTILAGGINNEWFKSSISILH